MGRVSVPLWLVVLSHQLSVVGLVGCYPANYLMERRLVLKRIAALHENGICPLMAMGY